MADFLRVNNIKSIDDQTKCIVFGFIRKFEIILLSLNKNKSYYNIPDLINHIVLIYYHIDEYFIINESYIEYNEQTNIIKNISNDECTVYGNIKINNHESNNYYNFYQWTFKIICNESTSICIGIDSSNQQYSNGDFSNDEVNEHLFIAYGDSDIYCHSYNTFNIPSIEYDKCSALKDGDNVIIQINVQTKQIHIIHHEQTIQCQPDNNIFNDNTFYLAVYLPNINDSVQLINFYKTI